MVLASNKSLFFPYIRFTFQLELQLIDAMFFIEGEQQYSPTERSPGQRVCDADIPKAAEGSGRLRPSHHYQRLPGRHLGRWTIEFGRGAVLPQAA